jgi:hypothetical protein
MSMAHESMSQPPNIGAKQTQLRDLHTEALARLIARLRLRFAVTASR